VTPERAFFDLQLRFASEAAPRLGFALERALLDCTNLYVRFGAGRDFDAAQPLWRDYTHGVRACADFHALSEWTWRFYQRCPVQRAAPVVVAAFGCFAWARDPHGGARVHFDPHAAASHPPHPSHAGHSLSPLDAREAPRRRDELRALVAHMHSQGLNDDAMVHGTSWLYNVPAYRRLFPDAYVNSAQRVERLRALSLWGQFIDRYGRVRNHAAAALLDNLKSRNRMEKGNETPCDFSTLAEHFPLQALAVRAPLRVFDALNHAHR
jgi:hypothetical protein